MGKNKPNEDRIKEIERIDKIIINMTNGEKANCPKCGEELVYIYGTAKITCPNKDFEVLLDFRE